MPYLRSFVLTFSLVAVLVLGSVQLVGCSDDDDAKSSPSQGELILQGEGPWGKIKAYKMEDGIVYVSIPSGKAKLRSEVRTSDIKIVGNGPWGKLACTYEGDRIRGQVSWGKIQLSVTDLEWRGEIPRGKFSYYLDEDDPRVVRGSLPSGKVAVRLADGYDSLTDIDVVLALLAQLSGQNLN